MLLGVVSESHGCIEATMRAVRMLKSLDVSTVLHCGDIGAPEIIALFAPWPTHFVLGNVDDHGALLADAARRAGQTLHGRFGRLELADRKVALVHGDDEERLREAIADGQYDVVCCGHTHLAEVRRDGPTLVVNPGAVFRAKRHTIATIDLAALEASVIDI